jgi:hypothetical protein
LGADEDVADGGLDGDGGEFAVPGLEGDCIDGGSVGLESSDGAESVEGGL